MTATFTVNDNFPILGGQAYTVTLPVNGVSGILGSIVTGALKGKTASAKLIASYPATDKVEFSLKVTDNIPFCPASFEAFDVTEGVPDFIYQGLQTLIPTGLEVDGTLVFA